MGINVSEEYGGPALDTLALSIAVEEIARLDSELHSYYLFVHFFSILTGRGYSKRVESVCNSNSSFCYSPFYIDNPTDNQV
jgi:hypothetical protein